MFHFGFIVAVDFGDVFGFGGIGNQCWQARNHVKNLVYFWAYKRNAQHENELSRNWKTKLNIENGKWKFGEKARWIFFSFFFLY